MNVCQRLWWEQAQADHSVLRMLRKNGFDACHQLHYLQMVTEKLGKAYFWRTGHSPPMSHAAFVRFLQALDNRGEPDRTRIANLLGFGRSRDFRNWIPTISPLAYDLERLAPALAGPNGPNAEYPWPWIQPTNTPVSYQFRAWRDLTQTSRGRVLLTVIDAAVTGFPQYG